MKTDAKVGVWMVTFGFFVLMLFIFEGQDLHRDVVGECGSLSRSGLYERAAQECKELDRDYADVKRIKTGTCADGNIMLWARVRCWSKGGLR